VNLLYTHSESTQGEIVSVGLRTLADRGIRGGGGGFKMNHEKRTGVKGWRVMDGAGWEIAITQEPVTNLQEEISEKTHYD